MNKFSEELRRHREEKNVTLADIAQQTRISIRYLQAIDQGAFDVLPQTYIRAFIKAYAEAIGMNASETLKQYDIHTTPEFREETAAVRQEDRSHTPSEQTDAELIKEKKNRSTIILTGLAVVAILIAAFIYNYMTDVVPTRSVKETSFQEVVKEHEKTAAPAAIDSADTVRSIAAAAVPHLPDSLVMRIVASDSVWLTIIRDSLPQRSGYMVKGRYRTYTAKKEFLVSVSDGGAVRITLNGKELAPLSARGKRVRNVRITAEDLK